MIRDYIMHAKKYNKFVICYFHPYEMMPPPFQVSFSTLNKHYGTLKAALLYTRQLQWTYWRANKAKRNLRYLSNLASEDSRLYELLELIFQWVEMDVKSKITTKWKEICDREKLSVPDFGTDFVANDLDSLGFAILVTELELVFGVDPFTAQSEAYYPETYFEFIRFYEQHVNS